MSTTWDVPRDPSVALSHDRPCCNCGCPGHVLPCGAEVSPGVLCPCRDVAVPGLSL
jgi:hypothetical protein